MQAIKFINWTDEDFVGVWGGVEYLIPSKQSMFLEPHLANHFAKHLTDRELNRRNLPTGHYEKKNEHRLKYEALCFGGAFTPTTGDARSEAMNLNAAVDAAGEESVAAQDIPTESSETKEPVRRGRKPKEKFEGLDS